nr:MAG TPA: hypothetical protein [Herelleviridae sp.]
MVRSLKINISIIRTKRNLSNCNVSYQRSVKVQVTSTSNVIELLRCLIQLLTRRKTTFILLLIICYVNMIPFTWKTSIQVE